MVPYGVMSDDTVRETRVCVLLFAAYRELLGASRLELAVPPGATLQDVYRALEVREPRLAQLRGATTFALNREVASSGSTVHDGDEIALLQPVSGGMT